MTTDVSATASVIARLRAEEDARPPGERLFADPFARLFTGGDDVAAIETRYRRVPFFREQVVIRTRFIDDALVAALGRGMRQLVLLGAGFDSRALRIADIAAAGAPVFEVDFADQLARKRHILTEAGCAPAPWNRYVPCDLAAPGCEAHLPAALAEAGFDRGRAAFVVWEGVITYLSDTDVDRTFRLVATQLARGSEIVFNYLRTRLDPATLPGRLAALGYGATRTWALIDLHRRYYGTPPPATPGGADEFYVSLATV
jgi:methyltransferase (TIGR00027 family)